MARYMMLLFIPEGRSHEEAAAESPKWMSYTQELHETGAFVSGDALQGNETATLLRVRDGETQLTDGPYAEAKELFNGFWILDVSSIDEAKQWARKCPLGPGVKLEVRRVAETEEFDQDNEWIQKELKWREENDPRYTK